MSAINVSLPDLSDPSETLQSVGALLGYARISTVAQDVALQHDALQAAGCDRVFSDTASVRHSGAAAAPWPIRSRVRSMTA